MAGNSEGMKMTNHTQYPITMATIKAGWGVNVGQDFTRVMVDTPIEITDWRGRFAYGYIKGDPNHALGFMRADRVRVYVDDRAIAQVQS
jgi:hypothetical protein